MVLTCLVAVDAETARRIEERLAELTGVSTEQLRDWNAGHIKAGSARRTGWRFVRGTQSGSYVRDPDGVDPLPAGYKVSA